MVFSLQHLYRVEFVESTRVLIYLASLNLVNIAIIYISHSSISNCSVPPSHRLHSLMMLLSVFRAVLDQRETPVIQAYLGRK